jgi:hypothetical protein
MKEYHVHLPDHDAWLLSGQDGPYDDDISIDELADNEMAREEYLDFMRELE